MLTAAAKMNERCSFSKNDEDSATCYTGNKVNLSPVHDDLPHCTQFKGSVGLLTVPLHSYKPSVVDLSVKKNGRNFHADENEETSSQTVSKKLLRSK